MKTQCVCKFQHSHDAPVFFAVGGAECELITLTVVFSGVAEINVAWVCNYILI